MQFWALQPLTFTTEKKESKINGSIIYSIPYICLYLGFVGSGLACRLIIKYIKIYYINSPIINNIDFGATL